MLGQRVNNFEIVRLLGEGGMGAVYEAEHALIRRKVAVKVLKPELAVDSELVQRFFNEARATSAIRHPNIVDVVDVGMLVGGVPYLVMELLEGESLAERLNRLGLLDIDSAVDVVRQAASALVAAHGAGIVHRDLKPENLFLVPDQRFAECELVKVLDFGIAKLRADMTSAPVQTIPGAVLGTPPYMSPEQCRGLPEEIDERTDIYALGIILYEALCGAPPFISAGIGEIMLAHMTLEPERPSRRRPELPLRLERVILKALAKRREDRFASMAEFYTALDRHLESAPTMALSGVPDEPTPTRAAQAIDLFAHSSAPAAPLLRNAPDLTRETPLGSQLTSERRSWLAPAMAVLALMIVVTVWRWPHATASRVPPTSSVAAARAFAPKAGDTAAATTASVAPAISSHQQQPPDSQPMAAGDAELLKAKTGASKLATSPSAPDSQGAPQPGPTWDAARNVPQQRSELATKKVRAAMHGDRTATSSTAYDATRQPSAAQPRSAESAATGSTSHATDNPTDTTTEPGYLSLDSSPWSDVFLGATNLGTTPIMHVPLPPGRHLLTLKNSELGTSTSYVVDIKSGKTISRLVGWEK